jgi:hypothetical protein
MLRGFTVEPFPELRVVRERVGKNLDCYGAIKAGVTRLVDLPHAATSEKRQDVVGAEAGTWGDGHVGAGIIRIRLLTASRGFGCKIPWARESLVRPKA